MNRASLEEKMTLTGNVKTRAVVEFCEKDYENRHQNHLKRLDVKV